MYPEKKDIFGRKDIVQMDELDFKVLITLAETGNLTRTAAKLYFSQPTLTKRLKNIEKELGAELFIRSSTGIRLTPMGERAVETAKKVSDELHSLRAFVQQNQDYIGGTLRVAASLDFSKYCMPDILERYTTSYPQVTLQVSTAHSTVNYQQLLDGTVQAAIVRGDYPWNEGIYPLASEAVCLIRAREDAGKPLTALRYISRYTDSTHMTLQTRWLIENRFSPSSTLHVDTLETCVELTRRGLGWSIVPEICLRNFDGIREPLFFSDGTPLRRNTSLMWRTADASLPQLKAFVDLVAGYIQEHPMTVTSGCTESRP